MKKYLLPILSVFVLSGCGEPDAVESSPVDNNTNDVIKPAGGAIKPLGDVLESLPVINSMSDVIKPLDILALTSREKRSGSNFKIYKKWAYVGIFEFLPSNEKLNDFEHQDLLDNFKVKIDKIREDYKEKPVSSHFKVTDLNIPVTLQTNGRLLIDKKVLDKHLGSKFGLYKTKVSNVLKVLSKDMFNAMSDKDRTFVFGTDLYANNDNRGNMNVLISDKEMVKLVGRANGGKGIIEEVTLKFKFAADADGNGRIAYFKIFSFKLKSTDGYFILDSKAYHPDSTYIPYNVKVKN